MLVLFFLIFLAFYNKASAHSGGTNANGCHNCYTSACYGDYHCHNGGSGGYAPSRPQYIFSAPENPKNGMWEYATSSENWCNYDVVMTWDKSTNGDRYSIAMTKTAGGDPGPLVDTTNTRYEFKNKAPGRWYINLKAGNSERWASNRTYWTVDLPKPSPHLTVYQDGEYLHYDLSCLDKVEGPQEFIQEIERNSEPEGKFKLTSTVPTTYTFSGTDLDGKKYSQVISYTPPKESAINPPDKYSSASDLDKDRNGLFWSGILGLSGVAYIYNRVKK